MGRRTTYEQDWFYEQGWVDCYRDMKAIMKRAMAEMTDARKEWTEQQRRDREMGKESVDR